MDGTLIKELPLFNYSYNLPIISGAIPPDWQKETCLEYTEEINYDSDAYVVVITSPGYDVSHSVEIAEKFIQKNKVVIFGAHMDAFSDKILRNICNSVFYGYPNQNKMREMLTDLDNGNLKNEYHFGNNINFAFDFSVLKKRKLPFLPMITSLGCKFNCSYCCYPPVFKGHYHLRKIKYVISDLQQVANFRKPVAFLDANLYNNRKYLIQLCNQIIKEKISLLWGGQCTIDIGDDSEVLSLLYKSGCRMLFFGLETIDNNNLILLNKPMNAEHYSRQVLNIHRVGIQIGAFFMLGLDEDDSNTFDKVYSFFINNRIEVPYVHLYFPIPGTLLAQKLKTGGRILSDYFDEYLYKQSKFSSPCSVAYFEPVKLSRIYLEQEYIRLFKRITSLKNIIKRILVPDLKLAFLILRMNLEARRKCRSMIRDAVNPKLQI
jgi:radical SAM superfamily enzyme YgiQ (UPF0313 family)